MLRKTAARDGTLPKSYRPISLLPTIAKLFDAVIAARMGFWLSTEKLLPAYHLGGRRGLSSDDCLLVVDHYLQRAKAPALLFTDLRSAFVNVRASYLIAKLLSMGLPLPYANVIKGWMSPRSLLLRTDRHSDGYSCIADVGMPQGSPLSTIAYLCFNSEVFHLAERAGLVAVGCVDDVCFIADDDAPQSASPAAVSSSEDSAAEHSAAEHSASEDSAADDSPSRAVAKLQAFLPCLLQWAEASGASFNEQKTQLLVPRPPLASSSPSISPSTDSSNSQGLERQDEPPPSASPPRTDSSHQTDSSAPPTPAPPTQDPPEPEPFSIVWPGGEVVRAGKTVSYLGVLLSSTRGDWSAQLKSCVAKADAALTAIRVTMKKFPALSAGARRRLLLTLVCPQLDWACELMPATAAYTKDAESLERRALRSILHAHISTNVAALKREMSWPSPSERRRHALAIKGTKLLCAAPDHPLWDLIRSPAPPNGPSVKQSTGLRRLLIEACTSSALADVPTRRGPPAIVPRMAVVESIALQPRPPWDPQHHSSLVPASKDEAIAEHERRIAPAADWTAIYCDGSTNDEASLIAGAAYSPALTRDTSGSLSAAERAAYLGPRTQHTSYEAELVGVMCACELLLDQTAPLKSNNIVLFVDNQAAIHVLDNYQYSTSQRFVTEARRLLQQCVTRLGVKILLQWVPGHRGVAGNEEVDRLAKDAATGASGAPFARFNPKIPRSILRSGLDKPRIIATKANRPVYQRRLVLERFARLDLSVDPASPPTFDYRQLENVKWSEARVMLLLRIGESKLKLLMWQRKSAPTPECQHCTLPETLEHVLFRCEQYDQARGLVMAGTGANPIPALSRLLFLPAYREEMLTFLRKSGRFPATNQ